jgi:hypothetical protein
MLKKLVLAVGLVAFVFSVAPAFAQTSQKCRANKTKCVCKKVCDKFKALAKNEAKPDPAKLAAAISKLEGKFTSCVGKAEAKGSCPSGVSTLLLEAKVNAFVDSVLNEIGSPSGAFVE